VDNVYRSVDDGQNWVRTNPPAAAFANVDSAGYTLALALAPSGRLYFASQTTVVESTAIDVTGALPTTWRVIADTKSSPPALGANGAAPHADGHAWAFVNGVAYLGTDGGLWSYVPRDDGTVGNWNDLNAGPMALNTIQPFSVTLNPAQQGHLLIGTQDNGTARTTGTNTIPGSALAIWTSVQGGDTGIVRYSSQTKTQILNQVATNVAYEIKPNYSVGNTGNTFMISTDDGLTWSPPGNAMNASQLGGKLLTALAVHPTLGHNVLVGEDGGLWISVTCGTVF
jgi:hypothetical protein